MIRAIIADDEPAAGIVIRHLVQKSKLPIEIIGVATDGQKALDMIRAKKPELVFLDIQMPRMNGFEIIQAEPHRKYIIVTAYESFQYAQQALRMGAKDILLKPVEYDTFCSSVGRAIGWKFTQNDMTNDILEYIQKNYTREISMSDGARAVNYSEPYFCKMFKQQFGQNFTSYVAEYRIGEAKKLLMQPNVNVKEVGERVGYPDSNYFTKVFKRMTGESPSEYRNQILKDLQG